MAPKTAAAPVSNGAKKPDHPRGPRPDRKKEEEVPVPTGPQVKTLAPVNSAPAQSGKSFLDALRSGKSGARAAAAVPAAAAAAPAAAAAAPAAAAKAATPKVATPAPEPVPEAVVVTVIEEAVEEVVVEPEAESEPEVVVTVTAATVTIDEPVSAAVMTLQNPAQIDWGATEEELKFNAQPAKLQYLVQYPEKVLDNRPSKTILFSAPSAGKDLTSAMESVKRDRQQLEAKARELEERRKEQVAQFDQRAAELTRRERSLAMESDKLRQEHETFARMQQQHQQQQQQQQQASFSGASSPQPSQPSPQSMTPQQAPHQAQPPQQQPRSYNNSYQQDQNNYPGWVPSSQEQRGWGMEPGAQYYANEYGMGGGNFQGRGNYNAGYQPNQRYGNPNQPMGGQRGGRPDYRPRGQGPFVPQQQPPQQQGAPQQGYSHQYSPNPRMGYPNAF